MRKFFFSLIGVLLLSTTAFGSDVLFKMVVTSPNTISCTNEEKDLTPYALVVGGSATIGTTSETAKNLLVSQSSVPYVRLDGGYLHVSLPRALQAGDVIRFTTYGSETKDIYLTPNTTRSHWTGDHHNEISPATDFTVTSTFATSAGRMNNSKELYFHYGANNGTYIKSLTITSSDNTDVTDYFFDGLDATTYASGTTDLFSGDIVVHSDGGSKIQDVRGVNIFYTNGGGTARYLDLTVTQPSTIEVYSFSPTGDVVGRKLHVSDDNTNNSALVKEGTEVVTITSDNINLMTKGVCEYNSFSTGHLYISPSTGGWNIAAIRVVKKASDIQIISSHNCSFSGGSSSNGIIWTSTTGNNITLANEAPSTTNPIASTADGANFTIDANAGLRLAGGRTYKVSVPSNKIILKAVIEAYAHQSTAKINVNGAGMSPELPMYNVDVAPTTFNQDINATSFTIETNSKNALVEIKLLTADLGYYPVSISNSWASFCAAEDVELPSGVYAYVANMIQDEEGDEDLLVINKVESSSIPANTGVLLYSETDGNYNLTSTTGAPAIEGTNKFTGTVARTANPSTTSETGTTYSLFNTGSEIIFARYIGAYIPANKAYLDLSASGPFSAPKRFRVQIGPAQMPTGVEAVSDQPSVASQKLIENGQLVIIRDGVKYNVQGQIIK